MSTQKPPAFFISGSLGLDFLNTLATPVDTQVDWIDDGDGLLAWLEQAGLVPAEDLKALKARAIPGEFDAVAAQARGLREWFRGFVRERSGRKLDGRRPARTRAAEPPPRPGRAVRPDRDRARRRGARPGAEDALDAGEPRNPCCCRSPRRSPGSFAAATSSTRRRARARPARSCSWIARAAVPGDGAAWRSAGTGRSRRPTAIAGRLASDRGQEWWSRNLPPDREVAVLECVGVVD